MRELKPDEMRLVDVLRKLPVSVTVMQVDPASTVGEGDSYLWQCLEEGGAGETLLDAVARGLYSLCSQLMSGVELWQIDAIRKLLSGEFNEPGTLLELDDKSFYTHSAYHGTSRRHIVSRDDYDHEVIISQVEPGEKYQQKVAFHHHEFEPVLKMFLLWHLEKAKAKRAEDAFSSEEALGSLDDQPF